MSKLWIKTCPTCGSKRIRRIKRDIESRRGVDPYVAHDIEIEECPDCGERLFSPDALAAIRDQQPDITKRSIRKKSA